MTKDPLNSLFGAAPALPLNEPETKVELTAEQLIRKQCDETWDESGPPRPAPDAAWDLVRSVLAKVEGANRGRGRGADVERGESGDRGDGRVAGGDGRVAGAAQPMIPEGQIPILSLWQPWASLLLLDDCKVHETRGWEPPSYLIGRRFAIHAAARTVRPAELGAKLHQLCLDRFGWPYAKSLPRGGMIGSAVLESSLSTDWSRPASEIDAACGDWTTGRFAWRFVSRGRQRIWYAPASLLEGEFALDTQRGEPRG